MKAQTILSALLISLTLTLGTSAKAAGLEGVKASAGITFSSELNGAFKAMAAKDILKEIEACRIVDAEFFVAPKLKESIGLLQSCSKALGNHAGIPVTITHELTPSGKAGFAIEVRLGAGAMAAGSFTRNLRHSLRIRRESLLGHPVKIVRGDWKPA